MAQVNQVIIVGNLTHDPELRRARSSASVTTFQVAVDDRRKTPLGELVTETTFVDVMAWCQLAEFITVHGRKGAAVLVVGRLKQDPESGKLRIVADRLQLFGEPEGKAATAVQEKGPLASGLRSERPWVARIGATNRTARRPAEAKR